MYSPQDKTGADPNRVGGPTNHLLSDGGLSTVIAGATNKTNSALTNSLQRLHTRSGGGSDRSRSTAFRAIGAICDKLGLVRVIKDRACELYKKVRLPHSHLVVQSHSRVEKSVITTSASRLCFTRHSNIVR